VNLRLLRRDRAKIQTAIERLFERPKFRPDPQRRTKFSKHFGSHNYANVRWLAQKLSRGRIELHFKYKRPNEHHENCRIHHRPEGQPPRFSSPRAAFCCGICNLGVLPNGFELFEGRTTGFHHDAARNFGVRDLHASARTSESFGRSESGNYEPDHQSTQSTPVPTQCRRRANFRAALRIRASNHDHKACEIGADEGRC
jgi:hypothetical protein